VCFGNGLEDRKGILGNVTLGESILYKWTMTGLPLKDGSKLEVLANKVKNSIHQTHQRPSLDHSLSLSQSDDSMTVWQGVFTLSRNILTAEDTFLHLPGWTKGTAFINGFNLGRYWPVVGPQITLYIPGVLLHTGGKENVLMLVEQENSPCGGEGECSVYMVDTPQIDGPTPY